MTAPGLAAQRPLASGGPLVDAARTAGYLVLAVPLGFLSMLALPTLLVRSSLPWQLATRERWLANVTLKARIPQLPDGAIGPARRIIALTPVRLICSIAAAAAALAPIVLTFTLVVIAAEGLSGTSDRYIGRWALGRPEGAVLLILALAAGVVSVAVLDGLGGSLRGLARRLLVPVAPAGGAVREALAESIGDQSLAIAYWLPDREVYVDERGLSVELPEPDSGRTWTAVEHEGKRLAAIVHDADLDARPELVRAAAAGAVLALDNERLKAALRARVEELHASRARIVDAGIEARRQLERELHDGAQQYLVALSLELQMLRARLAEEPETRQIVEASIEKLAAALAELRELAREIHPAILTDRGLDAAITALIDRTDLPVEYENEVGGRLAPAAEAAAYLVVLEALTNVLDKPGATRADVRLRRERDVLVVEVEDDGVGGTDAAVGTGLREVEDRVAALDGTLAVHSPRGQGTRIVARIPVGSA